jgi:hypothetical protein
MKKENKKMKLKDSDFDDDIKNIKQWLTFVESLRKKIIENSLLINFLFVLNPFSWFLLCVSFGKIKCFP